MARIPKMAGWEITDWCNLTCPHCYSAAYRRNRDETSLVECKNLIDEMAALGVEMIGLTGGEPLLRDDLEDIISYAVSKRIRTGLTTNGVLLDDSRARRLKEAGIETIQISLDGSTAERNYRFRRATDEEFEKVTEALRICRRLDIKLYLAMMIGKENLDDAPRMIELAKAHCLDALRLCGFTPLGRGKNPEVQKRLLLGDALPDLLALTRDAQADSNFTVMFDPGFGPTRPDYSFHDCVAGLETFYLKCNGDLYPCTGLLHKRFKVGNIRERALTELWHDPAMSEIAKTSHEKIGGACRRCDKFPICHGACRGATYAHTGKLDASFPACLYLTEHANDY